MTTPEETQEMSRAVFGFTANEADVFYSIFLRPIVSQQELLDSGMVPSRSSMFKVISRIRAKLKKICKGVQVRSSQHGSYWIEPEHKKTINAKLDQFLTQ